MGEFQLFHSKRQSFLALHWITSQRTAHRVLHRVHCVQIEEAVEEARTLPSYTLFLQYPSMFE